MVDYKVTELDEHIDFGNLPYWDVVIIGAGPGGLAASLTTAHRGLTTLVIEAKDKAGGQPQFLYADKNIVDVPGFPDGIRGDELSNRVYRQAINALVQFRFQEELVTIEDTDQIEKEDRLKRVVTTRDSYLCRKVILACGLLHYPRRLPVLDALESKKVFYKIPKIGDYEGQGVVVVGGGDSAFDAAVMAIRARGVGRRALSRGTDCQGRRGARASNRPVGESTCRPKLWPQFTKGTRFVLTLTNGEQLRADYVIVQIGFLSAKETFDRLALRLNEDGSIAIDPYFETSRRGIFAIGDVHGDIKLITVAWAEGIQAAIYAFKEITSPYWLNEKRLRDQKIAMIGDKISEAARTRGAGI